MTSRKPTTARRERRAFSSPKPPADELPPHDVEAEKALVGSILLAGCQGSQAQVDQILQGTRHALFYDLHTRSAWRACLEIRMAGHALDSVTFLGWCKDRSDYLAPANAIETTQWQDLCPSLLNWTSYRDRLTDLARRRNILAIAAKSSAMARDTAIDPASLRRGDRVRDVDGPEGSPEVQDLDHPGGGRTVSPQKPDDRVCPAASRGGRRRVRLLLRPT